MAMLVALTLAFPSCNVEMELGNNTLEYRERTAYLCSYDWQDDWEKDEWNACSTVRLYAFTVIKKSVKKNRQIKRTKHEISLL